MEICTQYISALTMSQQCVCYLETRGNMHNFHCMHCTRVQLPHARYELINAGEDAGGVRIDIAEYANVSQCFVVTLSCLFARTKWCLSVILFGTLIRSDPAT